MKKRKKLLVFASTFPRWRNDTNPPFVYELSRRLVMTFDVVVLTPHCPGSKEFEIMDGMNVYRFRYFPKKYELLAGSGGILPTLRKNRLFYFQVPFFMLGEWLSLRKLLKKEKPDVIHAHWIIPQGLVAAALTRRSQVPIVVTTHGGDIFGLQGRLPTKLKMFTLRHARSVTVVSSAIKKEIESRMSRDFNISIIPMGVDSTLFHPDKKDRTLRTKYGATGPLLLFVGRLAEKKGIVYLIKAMQSIRRKYPSVKLLIIGSGPLDAELRALTKSMHLDSCVLFKSAITNSELPAYYSTADIFIAPSIIGADGDREGLPVTVMEAMSSGTAVITTALNGNSDLITSGTNGYLIPCRDARAISDAVVNCLSNPIELGSIETAARRTIQRKFDWRIIAKKYSTILNNCESQQREDAR